MKKVLNNIFFVIIIVLLFTSIAYAGTFTITGQASSDSTKPTKPDPYSKKKDPNGITPTSATAKPSVRFIGLLVSLIDYQNTNGPDEKVLAKAFYIVGEDGDYSTSFETENYFGYDDLPDYYTNSAGSLSQCGNEDNYNAFIAHNFFEVQYAPPTRSKSLISTDELPIQEKRGYNFPATELEKTVEGLLIPEIIDEYYKYHSVLGHYIDQRIFDKYYLKYEPVYRSYPALMKEDADYVGITDDIFILTDGAEKHADPDVKLPYDLGIDTSGFGQRILNCDHEKREGKLYYVYNDVTETYGDSGSCSSAGFYWNNGKCIQTSSARYPNDDPDDSHVDIYQCFMRSVYQFHAIKLDGIESTMSTVREGYYDTGLTTSLFSGYSKNKHNAVNEYGLKMSGDDYFIGTTYNNAIAISDRGIHKFDASKHKYYLVDEPTERYSHDKVLGMAVYNLSETIGKRKNCVSICYGLSPDNSSDDYLRCAQSYCDTNIEYKEDVYATDLKRDCILYTCDYNPQKPVDCDNPVDNTIKNEAASDGTDGKTISNSSCGYTGSNRTNENRTVNKQKGSYYFCKRMGNGVKTTDSENKTYYKYGVSNTVDSYINIECKESAGFDFTDITQTHLTPGRGYEYSTYLDGQKTCRIFFDTVSWEFDFASTHSLDTIRKKLLLQKLNAFNLLASNKSGGIKVNGSELLGKEIEQEGTTEKLTLDDVEDDLIYLSALNYNISDEKASSKSKATEYIDSKADTSGNAVYGEGETFNLEIVDRSNSTSYNYKKNVNGLDLYHDYNYNESRQYNREGNRDINEYNVVSSGTITFKLPEICIATDNRRTLKRASESSCAGLGEFYNVSVPIREYMTSLKAKGHINLNNMSNYVSVKKSYFTDTVSASEECLKGEDTCPYDLPEDEIEEKAAVSCEIFIEKSATCYKSNDLYISTEPVVNARLIVNNDTNDVIDVDSQTIELLGTTIKGEKTISFQAEDLKTTTSSNGVIKSDNSMKIFGTLKIHSNDPEVTLESNTVSCEKDITIIKDSNDCTITKDGTSYWVETGADKAYATTGSLKDNDGNLKFTELTYKENGKFLYQVISSYKYDVVIAKIEDGSISHYCTYIPENCSNSKEACKEKFTKYQTKQISDYCDNYYEVDKYHYDSPTACYLDCSTTCIDCDPDPTKTYCVVALTAKQRENFTEVDNFCKGPDSAQEYDDCMDDCLNVNPPGSSTYIFRSINLNNPFPSSKFSAENGYQGGKRAIGQEWQIHYNKITEDKDQVMSGKEPEYVVSLDVSKINAIRNDTNMRNTSLTGGSIYSDTTNLPKVASCTSTGYTGYCSSFIHEDFTDYFDVVMGHGN